MRVHLFGLPKSAHIRLKAESDNWHDAVPPDHEFRSTPILSNDLGRISQSEIDELAKALGQGFNHLVLAGVREWRKVYACLQFDCRIHIARLPEPIRNLEWPILQRYLHAAVSVDEVWLSKVAPKDVRHALLLPPTVFGTTRDTAEYWRHCDVYSANRFESAEQLLARVEKDHRRPDGKGRSWFDNNRRWFRIDLSRHARSQADRAGMKSYRFCFEIPAGFHYDMTDASGRTFTVEIDGRSQSVTHCNVSPWGHIRRG